MTAPAVPQAAPPADLRAELMDCLQVNLAWWARAEYGVSPLVLGARLDFAPRDLGPGRLPTVEADTDTHVDRTAAALGLSVTDRHTLPPRTGIPPAGPGPVYVIADAYHLPWVPYHGHAHMEHSFLLGRDASGHAEVRDGYHNDTPYGPARPGTWTLTRQELAEALPEGARVHRITRAGLPQAAPRAVPADAAAVESYIRAYREHPDRAEALAGLTLETWLLARARRLHAAHRAAAGGPAAAVEEHLTAWGKLAEQTFLAHRRVQRGRPEPTGPLERLAELLHADARVFTAPAPARETTPAAAGAGTAGTGPPDTDPLRTAVAEEAAAVLRVPAAELLAGRALTDVPGFSSFRMVDIVERIEERLDIEFDAADLVPENLHDLGGLCRITARAHRETP
ncbi:MULTISPECIES: acyl carrier protein [unclassified Streptomyces]|uniref:acyl carrier protein n=1 Tax=unclassified Streptomyces TaxID=2593676 RepID=UPI0036AA7D62